MSRCGTYSRAAFIKNLDRGKIWIFNKAISISKIWSVLVLWVFLWRITSKFYTVICECYVSKLSWSSKTREELRCRKDDRKETNEYEEAAVCVYKKESSVGHVPIELSSLMDFFIDLTMGMILIPLWPEKARESLAWWFLHLTEHERIKAGKVLDIELGKNWNIAISNKDTRIFQSLHKYTKQIIDRFPCFCALYC